MNWENSFLEQLAELNQNSSFDWLSNIMKFFSLISELGIVWIVITIAFIAIKKMRKMGVTLAFGLFFFAIFVGAVATKLIFHKIRPVYASEDLMSCTQKWLNPTGSEVLNLWCIPERTSYSFVSTRAFTGFLCATIMLFFDKRFGIPAYVLAAFVAFSRIYFGLVYPIDSIIGAVLGAGFGVLSVFLSYKFYDKIRDFFDSIFTTKETKK